MKRAQCIKKCLGVGWSRIGGAAARPGGSGRLPAVLLLLGLVANLPGQAAPALRSLTGHDPWLRLAWPADSLAGAGAVFEGLPAARRPSVWLGWRRPFGLSGLSSSALAASLPLGKGAVQCGLHLLAFEEWRESQLALDWAPTAGRLRPALGFELDRSPDDGRTWRGRLGLVWTQGPLWLAARLDHPLDAPAAGGRRGVGAAWSLGRGCHLVWRVEGTNGSGPSDEGALVWQGRGLGLAGVWRPGRGGEVGGRLEWKGLTLQVAWWSHPVLPPTPGWGLGWGGARP